MKTSFKRNYGASTCVAALAAGVLLAGSNLAGGQETGGKPLTDKELVHEIWHLTRRT